MGNIKMIQNRGSLSESDLSLLKGDPILVQMMRNRKVIQVDNGIDPNWEDLTKNVQGLYHIRRLNPHHIYQIWFELQTDIDIFEKNLFSKKLSL